MPVYRIYVLSSSGRVDRAPITPDCQTDEEAIAEAASRRCRGHAIEVWDGTRLVASLPPLGGPVAPSPEG